MICFGLKVLSIWILWSLSTLWVRLDVALTVVNLDVVSQQLFGLGCPGTRALDSNKHLMFLARLQCERLGKGNECPLAAWLHQGQSLAKEVWVQRSKKVTVEVWLPLDGQFATGGSGVQK